LKCPHCSVTLTTNWIKTAQQVSKDPKCPKCGRSVITQDVLNRGDSIRSKLCSRAGSTIHHSDYDGLDLTDILILYLVFGDVWMADNGFDESAYDFPIEEASELEAGDGPVDIAPEEVMSEPAPEPERYGAAPAPEPSYEPADTGGYDGGGGCDFGD